LLIVGTGRTWGGVDFLWVHDPSSGSGPDRVPWESFRSKMMSLVTVSRQHLDTMD